MPDPRLAETRWAVWTGAPVALAVPQLLERFLAAPHDSEDARQSPELPFQTLALAF